AGFPLKEQLKAWLAAGGHRVIDHGTHSTDSVDYPDYAAAVAEAVRAGGAERGVLVCGSGIGMAMAANKVAGVRAAVAGDPAVARAKELFGAEHANVQPHSGAQANMAVYFTLLKPGDTVLGPNLSHGGHLTAGSPVNYSGKFYSIVAYGVRKDTERIDLDQ